MREEHRLEKIVKSEFSCTPESFWRAASQRVASAIRLLESQSHLDAVYLAGYVVECALKALILKRTPANKRRDLCQELSSGARSHNFDYLSGTLVLRQCTIPREVRQSLDVLSDEWSTDLRYVGNLISYREAERFIQRVQAVYEWVERSL
jgi:HEPN domain-containing protein